MRAGEARQAFLAFGGEMDFHAAAVIQTGFALNQSRFCATRNQRNGAMLMRLQFFGEFTDRRPIATGKAFDVEKKEVLQWCDPFLFDRFLAEAQEASQLITKFR